MPPDSVPPLPTDDAPLDPTGSAPLDAPDGRAPAPDAAPGDDDAGDAPTGGAPLEGDAWAEGELPEDDGFDDEPEDDEGDAFDDDEDGPLDPDQFFDDDPSSRAAPLLLDLADVPEGHRSGYVALVGAPNVGKSTLLNRLLGTKIAIVTPKPSTTRNRVLGILSAPDHQVVLLDTPGVVRPKYRLHEHMLRDVDRALNDADLTLYLADGTRPQPGRDALDALDKLGDRPAVLVLTKSDLLGDVGKAMPVAEQYLARRDFEAVVPISAQTGYNVDALLGEVLSRMPLGPPFYPKDQLSEHPERFFVAEIVREAIFNQFRDEVPYSTQVNIIQYEAHPEGKDFIACDIVVERDSQKGILIGKGGQALKALGAAARIGIEDFLDRPVFLKLFVKTRPDWRDRAGFLREYGFGGQG